MANLPQVTLVNGVPQESGTVSTIDALLAVAATSAKQDTAQTSLTAIAAAQGSGGTSITEPAGGSGILGWLSGIFNKLNTSIAVTGTFFQATQPVSLTSVPSHAVTNAGTFAVQVTSAPTTAVTATSLPLPAGAATATGVASIVTALGTPLQAGGSVVITNANPNGRALPSASAPVVLNSQTGQFVSASSTAAQLGTTGAVGDNLDGVLIIPATAAAGAVSVLWDGTNTRQIFAGGGVTALPTLAPFFVPLGFVSGSSGGFKLTTGANVSVIGVGNFT